MAPSRELRERGSKGASHVGLPVWGAKGAPAFDASVEEGIRSEAVSLTHTGEGLDSRNDAGEDPSPGIIRR